ncbi:hypothetical protein J1N35_044563 [Gossypium stocksii]|uniref:Aminotransferase-like plant mobile domain-containing protein n=1 Tax=Gossypium stocksii TaxID=47602 RepID=A0A9D3ZFV5_9ROSI|nr:hypothetical protein J1N35_044563 [Gossypium stocksii]
MADDCVLDGFIHNMGKPAILEICGHWQATGFSHVSRMSGGCKLDLALINTLVERWRLGTHTFPPCGKCTITLEDVAVQLGPPVDGPVIMGSMIIPGKVDLCTVQLGKVPDKFEGGDVSCHFIECGVDWWLRAPAAAVGLVATIVSMSQGDRLIHVPVSDEKSTRAIPAQ